jgi:hypothetical protein
MQMIDVIKRLAELDSANPRVEKVAMTNEQSLATVSNIEGETITENVNECGPMGMMGGMDRPTTPATFSINASAQSGDEVSSMLRDIMNLAGVKAAGPAMGDLDHDGDHDMQDHGIELSAPHAVELEPQPSAGDEMGGLIGMIDKMNGPSGDEEGPADKMGGDEGPTKSVSDMADEVEGMTAQLKDEGIGAGFDTATTTPDEKVEPHKYGNDQVTPKPAEPNKKAGGGNPYNEAIEQVSLQLLKAYEEFKKQ